MHGPSIGPNRLSGCSDDFVADSYYRVGKGADKL